MHNWQFTGNISQNSYGPHIYEKLVGFTLITPLDISRSTVCVYDAQANNQMPTTFKRHCKLLFLNRRLL